MNLELMNLESTTKRTAMFVQTMQVPEGLALAGEVIVCSACHALILSKDDGEHGQWHTDSQTYGR